MIEDVEKFGSEFQRPALGEVEPSMNREVELRSRKTT